MSNSIRAKYDAMYDKLWRIYSTLDFTLCLTNTCAEFFSRFENSSWLSFCISALNRYLFTIFIITTSAIITHKRWRFAFTGKWLAGLPSENLSWCRDSGYWRLLLWGSTDKGCEGVLQGRKPCRHFWRRCVFISDNIFCFSDLRNIKSITRKISQVRQAPVCQVDSRY